MLDQISATIEIVPVGENEINRALFSCLSKTMRSNLLAGIAQAGVYAISSVELEPRSPR